MKHSRLQIVSTPMLVVGLMTLTLLLGAAGLASASPAEVLYVTQPQAIKTSLATYNVSPLTGVAVKVGPTITVEGSSVTPLSIGTKHVIYVWNATQVWTYVTDTKGVPNTQPSQHLTFGFPYPVNTFLADPNGKFAYAALVWFDSFSNANAEIILFTIDQSTGKLTNTNKVVARFGPDPYMTLTAFSFGRRGRKLFTSYYVSAGHSGCFVGKAYYPVNQTNGQLGSFIDAVSFDCSFATGGVAITDETKASAQNCCGPGAGSVGITRLDSGQSIGCGPAMQTVCGDDLGLSLDPGGQNLFFADSDTGQVSIGHIDWTNSTVVLSLSTIPGTPPLYFSPDSKLVYAVNATDIGIYALQSISGTLTASTSLAVPGNVSVATATLY